MNCGDRERERGKTRESKERRRRDREMALWTCGDGDHRFLRKTFAMHSLASIHTHSFLQVKIGTCTDLVEEGGGGRMWTTIKQGCAEPNAGTASR